MAGQDSVLRVLRQTVSRQGVLGFGGDGRAVSITMLNGEKIFALRLALSEIFV